MRDLYLDLADIDTMDDFHDRVSSALGFPHYYGRNLDAFWDCVTDLSKPTTVHIKNLGNVSSELRERLDDYIEMMREHQEETNGVFSVKFEGTNPPGNL